jgi:hypothetical protein
MTMTNPGLKTFSSKRYERVTFPFDLEGKTYYATPGKETDVQLALMNGAGAADVPAQVRMQNGLLAWLLKSISPAHIKGFETAHTAPVPECAACEIMDRLADDNDPLELETLLDVANWLIGELGKRPTTPSSAS